MTPTYANSHVRPQVIVGGGTAGGALATRLSVGLPDSKILLLEAGPSALDEIRINIPGMRGSILGTEYDWNFTSIPQTELDDRVISVNRGRVLGGSSAMNYLCYDRASSAEYDAWGELGSPGWNWKHMIKAMVRSENFTGNDGDAHGHCGPIRTSYSRIVPRAIEGWQDTISELGVSVNDGNSLGGKPVGVMFQPTNIDVTDHTRSYSAKSYLPKAGQNLKVMTNTHVAKVLLSRGGTVATGVELTDGTTIAAKKEVILSAGSIQSPGLLEVSGIGQKSVLKKAGIKQLVDLPGVGENLQDHLRTMNTYQLKEGYESFDPIIYDQENPWVGEQLDLWFQNEKSWFDYTTSAYSLLNWAKVSKAADKKLQKVAKSLVAKRGNNAVDRKKLEYLRDHSVPQLELLLDANYVGAAGYPGGAFITMFASVMHPMSRGSVHVKKASTLEKPEIDLKYFTNEYDINAMVEGAKFARKVANTKPLSDVWETEYEPGPEVQTDEEFRAWAIKTVDSFYHPIGTCALLPKRDGGVVDKNLRVYGVKNLRVVDASIIPIQMSGHIQTAVYGIAETAAEKIIGGAHV